MKHIVVVLHGYASKTAWYKSVKEVIESCYTDATVLLPSLGMKTFSVANPDDIVAGVLKLIDAEWEKEIALTGSKESVKVVIIGHSTGSVLARKLYVAACGENPDAPFEKSYAEKVTPRAWAGSVDRIILFAGMNRGWTVNHHLYTSTALLIRLGIFIGHIIRLFGHTPLAFKTRRGATFITQLRIQWLSMLRNANKKGIGGAMVIQLLGTIDDIISPEDNIDLITGGNFIYLEVPASDHMGVLNMHDRKYGPARTAVFTDALKCSQQELFDKQIRTSEDVNIKPDESVTDVVFVIHGIRDTGYWTQKVARRVKAAGDKAGRKFATETSTYGYFPMLSFLIPFFRREKVEWLMDQYTENLALYPNAKFSFMGHSNGTYLLAKALKEYPACTFKNVVFAGSVVQSKFNWSEMILQKRISSFYNFVASSDWVVAIFPKTFQVLPIQDLGSGGFDGFVNVEIPSQLKFVKGGHGAATEERYWDEIANLIVHGNTSDSISQLSVTERSSFMRVLGAAAPLPFFIIVALVFLMGWTVFHIPDLISTGSLLRTPDEPSFKHISSQYICLVFYLYCVWKAITKL